MGNLCLAFVCALFIGFIAFLILVAISDTEKTTGIATIIGFISMIIIIFCFNNVSRTTYYDELSAMNIKLEELEKEKQETTADNKFMITNEIAEMKSAIYLKEKEKTYWWNWHLK